MARILLGVSGGIAAYRALELARLATLAGHGLRVLMTPNAGRFVGAASFEAIVGAPVLVSEFEPDPMRGRFPGEEDEGEAGHDPISHLELAARADAYLIAPATANTLAKLAGGQADSLLTTAFLACQAPRLVAPAMNDRMFTDSATQANLDVLRGRGVRVIDPDRGRLASRGEQGQGRLAQPQRLLDEIESTLHTAPKPWHGLRVLVSAGGTREPLDDVRFLGNRSSGKMGMAIAAEAARLGAEVKVVCANVALTEPSGVERVDVETAAEMATALAESFAGSDILVMAAAVGDFTPSERIDGKVGRADKNEPWRLDLVATEDVVAGLAAGRRAEQILVGFAAESGPDSIDRARQKLERKGLDLIVFNDISSPGIGFDADENEITLVDSVGERHIERTGKDRIAAVILGEVARLRGLRVPRGD